MSQATSVVTSEVRLSYVNLLQPRANQQGGEPRYSVTILLPKSDQVTYQRIMQAIQSAYELGVTTKWNGARPPLKHPIHDGDGVRPNGEPFGPECKGHWVFTASSKQKPEIVDLELNPILDPTKIYSGVYGRVYINFFPYSNSGNRGIGAGLGPVQITRDGEPLGGRVTAEEAFGNTAAPSQMPSAGYSTPANNGRPTVPQQQVMPQQAQEVQQQYDPITGQPLGGGIYGI